MFLLTVYVTVSSSEFWGTKNLYREHCKNSKYESILRLHYKMFWQNFLYWNNFKFRAMFFWTSRRKTSRKLYIQKTTFRIGFYAEFSDVGFAIDTEKRIKKWSKAKKEALINNEYEKLPNLAKKKFKK